MRSRARAAVLAVVAALVDLAPLAGVARLAAALGHLAGVEEAAAAVQTLQVAGSAGRSCGRKDGRDEGRTDTPPPDLGVRRCGFGPTSVNDLCVRGLTERGLGGGGPLHARAVVGHVVVGAGAHRPAGAEQAQPLALLPVTRVGGHWREGEREMEGEKETSIRKNTFLTRQPAV